MKWNLTRTSPLPISYINELSKLVSRHLFSLDAREELSSIFMALPKKNISQASFFLHRVAMAIGLFEVSEVLFQLSAEDAIRQIEIKPKASNLVDAFKASIALGDLERSYAIFEQLRGRSESMDSNLFRQIARYVEMCGFQVQENSVRPVESVGEHGPNGVLDEEIYIIGPAPFSKSPKLLGNFEGKVVRRIGIGATSFDSHDGFGGQCDLAYSDALFANYVNSGGKISNLDQTKIISLTQNVAPLPVNSRFQFRVALNPNALFFSGGANKVQIMIYDLLSERPKKVHLSGINFFASTVAYSSSNRDVAQSGLRINSHGTSGLSKFEACNSLASHNPFTNRNFVKNLLGNIAVAPDKEVASILAISDKEYAQNLDKIYGVPCL